METVETLPVVIIIDILLRLPAKPLLRFKCVCKLWYDLISCPDFAKRHLQRSLATQSNLHFVFRNPVLHKGDFDSFENAVELNYPYKRRKDGGVTIIGSCNGLLCLNFDYHKLGVILLNPTTRTHKIIPLLSRPSHDAHIRHRFIAGFGYDRVSDDYKFVRILLCSSMEKGLLYSELMVYSLKSDSWARVLSHVPIHFNYRRGDGVFVNENLHWVNDT